MITNEERRWVGIGSGRIERSGSGPGKVGGERVYDGILSAVNTNISHFQMLTYITLQLMVKAFTMEDYVKHLGFSVKTDVRESGLGVVKEACSREFN